MKSSDIEQELKAASVAPANGLPSGFSSQVLAKARAVKKAAQEHWRLLASATVIALIAAAYISDRLASSSTNKPPSIPVFDSSATLIPDSSPRH